MNCYFVKHQGFRAQDSEQFVISSICGTNFVIFSTCGKLSREQPRRACSILLYPETQRKAQAEIDRVVGDGRSPDLREHELLDYMEAILREVQRWQPVSGSGGPCYIDVDDEYRGYELSIIMTNAGQSSTTRRSEIYPDPYTFNPER
ncbi:Cytochrome P450 2J2 [Marasmius tenuissimus]|uniref:Cytochrome P450 2J2 n=1 Tax=Marasmius tenuissimus TaxID=585030 RepID=A0ABR2ZYG6_9AGAR